MKLARSTKRMAVILPLLLAMPALAQSSSLYVTEREPRQARPQTQRRPRQLRQRPAPQPQPRRTATGQRQAPHRLSPAIRSASVAAVQTPQPQQFAVNDLVTIIIRESTETDFESNLETEKSSEHTGEIAELPRLTLQDLVDLQVPPNQFEKGNPALDVQLEREFEGEGQYSRSEEMTGRITARILDVKPNGTLVLEARKFIESDGESFDITLTGTARAEDITADNTVLSTELYDLHLSKENDGALETASEKGVITKILDFVFNF